MTELPRRPRPRLGISVWLSSKFDPGMLAPLTVVLESDTDFRSSEGLALIDDVSRLLSHQRQADRGPLGDPAAGQPRAARACPAGVAAGRGQRRLSSALRRGRAASKGAHRRRSQAASGDLAGRDDRVDPDRKARSIISCPRTDDSVARASTGRERSLGPQAGLGCAPVDPGMPEPWNLPVLNNAFDCVIGDQAVTQPQRRRPGPSQRQPAHPATTVRPKRHQVRETAARDFCFAS